MLTYSAAALAGTAVVTLNTGTATYSSQVLTAYQATDGPATFAAGYAMLLQIGTYTAPSTPA